MCDRPTLEFRSCQRGFTLTDRNMRHDRVDVLAFDHIEDLAAWLVETYKTQPASDDA